MVTFILYDRNMNRQMVTNSRKDVKKFVFSKHGDSFIKFKYAKSVREYVKNITKFGMWSVVSDRT